MDVAIASARSGRTFTVVRALAWGTLLMALVITVTLWLLVNGGTVWYRAAEVYEHTFGPECCRTCASFDCYECCRGC